MNKGEQKIEESENKNENSKQDLEECFVIMPISNQEGYENEHFNFVYDDIFKPAILKAGFKPYRVDESKSSNVIHVEIIKRLIEAPMAICDLSARNPNVLYELGIRQAFDKPVVLVGDDDPSKIFDVGNINTHMYGKNLNYRSVLSDQEKITDMIKETYTNHKNGTEMNSLISILKVSSALNNYENKTELKDKDLIKIMYKEILTMKDTIKKINKKELCIESDSSIKSEFDEYLGNLNYMRIKNRKAKIDKSVNAGIINMSEVNDLFCEIKRYLKENDVLISNKEKYILNNIQQELKQYLNA